MKNLHLQGRQFPLCRSVLFFICSVGILVLFLQGCAAPKRNPVPENMVTRVRPLQMEKIRVFVDPWNKKDMEAFFTSSLTPLLKKYAHTDATLTMLALSGGGDGGAFGAGLLNGWSTEGSRPQFDIVTGISTGALMSPFAFLGSAYDDSLRAVYTEISADNIYSIRSIREMISSRDALADSMPLAHLLTTYVDDQAIQHIGMEHQKGRRLFIGTTHLDSGQMIVWDMGAIALSGHPEAPELFRNILLASASIPIAFPPVYIQINTDTAHYDEMHVDGGLINQVFGIETLANILVKQRQSGQPINAQVFLIRNSAIKPKWEPAPRELVGIANRTVDIMINSQSLGDIFRNYVIAKMTGISFYYTGIPADFQTGQHDAFDTDYMNTLFDVGYQAGKTGSAWESQLPGLEDLDSLKQ